MRWTVNCILLATVAVISASEDDARMKRDLTFIKNFLPSKLFGFVDSPPPQPPKIVRPSGNYRLYRIPGFEKVLVKAIPKRTGFPGNDVVEVSQSSAVVEQNPDIAIVNSYLGTSQLNETLYALQGVRNLLQSGVLEAQREGEESSSSGSFTAGVGISESGKLVIGQRPYTAGEAIPVPMIEGYRPVEITRLQDLKLPTKYSYKQVNSDSVTSYAAKDNKNVIVSRSSRPVPLPPYVSYRIQEVMSLGAHRVPTALPVVTTAVNSHPPPLPIYNVPTVLTTAIKTHPPISPPIPVYNVPRVEVMSPPVKIMPTVVSPGYSINRVPLPEVLVPPPPPVKMTVANIPGAYSYDHIRNDGSITRFSGSGEVIERNVLRPPVVVTEVSKPAPIPGFLTNRIEKVAMAAKIPSSMPHVLHDGPVVVREQRPVIVEEIRPHYEYVSHWPPYGAHDYKRPLYREDFNIYLNKNKIPDSASNRPAEYSYKTVHNDGSVTTYSDAGVFEEGNKEYETGEPILFPTKYAEGYNYHNHHNVHSHPHLVREEICLDPPSPAFYPNHVNHVHPVYSKPSGYSYKTVHNDGLLTTYSGSGHMDIQNGGHLHPISMAHPLPSVMVPETVNTQGYFAEDQGPQKVMFSQPVLSQYVYKQINHNDPNAFTGADMGSIPVDGQVNVRVGEAPVPKPYLTPPPPPPAFVMPSANQLPVLPSVTPKVPNAYVFVPPADINELLPASKPVDGDKAESGHSFSVTHVTNEGVHTNKDGAASFESVSSTMPPVVKIEKTSSSVSVTKSKPRPKFGKVKSRVATTTTTAAPEVSLSSNPIVVPDEPTFSFKQDRADGSSITVIGNKENVSVIEDNRTDDSLHRGDIPNTSL